MILTFEKQFSSFLLINDLLEIIIHKKIAQFSDERNLETHCFSTVRKYNLLTVQTKFSLKNWKQY